MLRSAILGGENCLCRRNISSSLSTATSEEAEYGTPEFLIKIKEVMRLRVQRFVNSALPLSRDCHSLMIKSCSV